MIEFFGSIAVMFAVAGALLVNRGVRVCFYLWVISNSMLFVVHLWAFRAGAEGMVSMMVLDAVFLVLAIEGWVKWKKKDKVSK